MQSTSEAMSATQPMTTTQPRDLSEQLAPAAEIKTLNRVAVENVLCESYLHLFVPKKD